MSLGEKTCHQIPHTNTDGKQAVLMSLDEFNAWQETMHLLSNPANANRLLQSIQDAEAGRFTERALIEE